MQINKSPNRFPQVYVAALLTFAVFFAACESSFNTNRASVARNETVPNQPPLSTTSSNTATTNTGAPLMKEAAEDKSTAGERYAEINENPFLEASRAPLSTFSIDVDTASYANVRRYLNDGQMPPKDAVRIEELINYFEYDYPQPVGGVPFSVTTEAAACPWNTKNRLVLIGLQGKKVSMEDTPPSNLVFLVDVSGSMSPANRLPLVKQGLKLLANQLSAKDRVAIVTYAGSSQLVLPSTRGDRKSEIIEAIDSLNIGGSTNGGGGIKMAYRVAQENFIANGNNRVVLASDGDFNVGVTSDSELVSLIEEKRKSNVFLSVLSFGTGNLNDSMMEKLADKGNGNYAYIDSLEEARKALGQQAAGTLYTIAKDVKIQVEFNPSQVAGYRLIGYENRLLADRDFNDDKKDAGEIGAGISVTALYEVVPAGQQIENPGVDELKYGEKVASSNANSNELLTVKLRYKEPNENESKLLSIGLTDNKNRFESASENLRFASSVAQFGLLLRDSRYKGSANFQNLLAVAQNSRGNDLKGYRGEFVELVSRAKNAYSQQARLR
jgi:Ca-activated chloride channel homolog